MLPHFLYEVVFLASGFSETDYSHKRLNAMFLNVLCFAHGIHKFLNIVRMKMTVLK